MPNAIATITGEQRDAIYEHIVERLTFLPDLHLCLRRGDVAIARRLSREFRQDLRLLDDLGLGDDGRSQVPVTMPADELAETLARLRADARGGLTESPEDRSNRELEEADRRRYRLIEQTAAEILAELEAQGRSRA